MSLELEASALARRTGIRCQLGGNRRIPPLHPDQITGVFRIVQEALTNVVRHVSASSVRISIDGTAAAMAVKVKDNGRGRISMRRSIDPRWAFSACANGQRSGRSDFAGTPKSPAEQP